MPPAAGVLASTRCAVDSDTSNDTPRIGRDAIDVRTVQLDGDECVLELRR